jgi:hypothetical protein
MQSRWWDFGGNTIIRADQYVGAIQSGINRRIESRAYFCVADTYD